MTNNRAPDNAIKDLHEDLTKLADERLKAQNDLKEAQVISRTLLQYEAKRLEKRFGKDHPRTQQIKARLEQNLDVINDLEVESHIARIKVPEVSENDTLIHGRVMDESYRGFGGLNVTLTDSKGKALTGKSETEGSGYYSIVIDQETLKKLSEVIKEGVFLAVFSRKCETIHRQCEPIKINEGDRILAEMVLDRENLITGRVAVEKPPEKEKTKTNQEIWIVRGRVTDENERGIKGLMVSLFDKDHRYDDKLGAELTGKNGEFKMTYRTQDFREGNEPGPDLYLTVRDKDGNILYTSEKAVRYDAGREEVFDITIKGRDRDQ